MTLVFDEVQTKEPDTTRKAFPLLLLEEGTPPSPDFSLPDQELPRGEYGFGIATTPDETIGRLHVVTQRYSREGYLDEISEVETDIPVDLVISDQGLSFLERNLSPEYFHEFLEHGLLLRFPCGNTLYLDKYHWQSVQFVARGKEGIVGSARLILHNPDAELNFPLPTLSDRSISINPEHRDKAQSVDAEFSQFAKLKEAPSVVAIGLLRVAAQFSRWKGIPEWLATTDNVITRLLNSTFFNFGLPKIGPSVEYLGSMSTPIFINIETALQHAEGYDTSRASSNFLSGNNEPGFEWYHGV